MSSPHDTITGTKNSLRKFKLSTAILTFLLTIACGFLLRDMYLISMLEDTTRLVIKLHNEKNHELNECHILLGRIP